MPGSSLDTLLVPGRPAWHSMTCSTVDTPHFSAGSVSRLAQGGLQSVVLTPMMLALPIPVCFRLRNRYVAQTPHKVSRVPEGVIMRSPQCREGPTKVA